MKIANDLRWLASAAPGLGELEIPPVQPGSSIIRARSTR